MMYKINQYLNYKMMFKKFQKFRIIQKILIYLIKYKIDVFKFNFYLKFKIYLMFF